MHEPRPLNDREGALNLQGRERPSLVPRFLDLFILQLLLGHAYLPVTRASLDARDMAPAAGLAD